MTSITTQTENHRDRSRERRSAWDTLNDSTTVRLVALMGGHEWIRWRADFVGALSRPSKRSSPASVSSYFQRRSREERRAAHKAANSQQRKKHEARAGRYAKLSEHRSGMAPSPSEAKEAARRQDALLDRGLMETFPASDPVSAPRIS